MRRTCAAVFGTLLAALCCALPANAQTRNVPLGDRAPETTVSIVLLTGAEGVGLAAQDWHETFEKLNVSLQIRRALPTDKVEVTERKLGLRLRQVHVVGQLDRSGAILVPGKKFTRADHEELVEWIQGLKIYGAQGDPAGQPHWGISKTQFDPLLEALTKDLQEDPQGKTLDKALALFQVQNRFPFRFTTAATKHLESKGIPTEVKQSLGGFSEGTALAIVLNEFGLGFYPRRTPEGRLELILATLQEVKPVWPAGWPPVRPGIELVPQLYDSSVEIELKNEPLADVMSAVGDLVKLPVLYDQAGLRQHKLNPETIKVSHPKKKVPWSLALKRLAFQARCRWELRSDEAGHPFLWTFPDIPDVEKRNPPANSRD